jgi:excinuclease ABC subunit A
MNEPQILNPEELLTDEELTDCIEVRGARVHNLKNIDVSIPREKLIVITGLSGSGKSSLAFDTIFAEAQRRYIETFSGYARQFLGSLEKPDVDRITGLSPAISIEQKTTGRNPRSTVGTITEVYDFLRLLYARASDAYSRHTNEPMVRYTDEQIAELIMQRYPDEKVLLLAPMVRGRKGHYRELFESLAKQGYLKARIDGEVKDLTPGMMTDRYKVHDIEAVIDRVVPSKLQGQRLLESVRTALKMGKGTMMTALADRDEVKHYSLNLMCAATGESYPEPEPNLFSFNSPYGACPHCNGLGEVVEVDINKIIPDRKKSLKSGGIAPLAESRGGWFYRRVEAVLALHGHSETTALSEVSDEALAEVLYGTDRPFTMKTETGSSYQARFEGLLTFIERQAEESESAAIKRWAESFTNKVACPRCNGTRLREEALYFRLNGTHIADLAMKDLKSLAEWLEGLENHLSDRQNLIAREPLKEVRARLGFLLNVGLEYLTLHRGAGTLSGGEAQRIRLATQIGSRLVGVTYILDEPSIGLHQRDNQRLINSLKELRDAGNTVIVVEHDRDMMVQSDHLIDIGPGAGVHGGRIVAQGRPDELIGEGAVTAKYLTGEAKIEVPAKRRKGNGKKLEVKGATGHNLRGVDLAIPLGTITCVTGVSGSGKSSLINGTLWPILSAHYYNGLRKPLPYKSVKGLDHLDKVVEIDQSPIGRTPRSNPATYTGMFGPIRDLFANLPESKVRGYKPGRFSFNVSGGRCETCKGAGVKVLEMNFLPDVEVECDTCMGKRYNRETLEVRYKGKSISDVLNMTIESALGFFEEIPSIARILRTLNEVGLGYVTIGQSSTTLSGGEAQRVKLSTELSKRSTGKTIYIMDEPTTGLHFQDVQMLLNVLNRLAEAGNTVLVIEHNMDIIKSADHIIDLGPEGGRGGGTIVATGTPEQIASHPDSITGRFLREELDRQPPAPAKGKRGKKN